jgi:hypothetical protein
MVNNKKINTKIVIEHANMWNWGREGGRIVFYKPSQQNQVHEQQCKEMVGGNL